MELFEEEKRALVKVPNDQLSLAIGKRGQNVRLAAKLTGWKIDVASDETLGVKEPEAKEEIPGDIAPEEIPPVETEEAKV